MGKIIYVTGGARSGKSSFSENKAKEYKEKKKIYIATGIPYDKEMKDRIEKHKIQRGDNWETIEAYEDIIQKIEEKIDKVNKNIILLDCITNMVANLMLDYEKEWDNIEVHRVDYIEIKILNEIKKIIEYIKEKGNIEAIFVSNEVGMGLVPPYPLGRHFRDIAGRINQVIGKESDEAYLLFSGIEVRLK